MKFSKTKSILAGLVLTAFAAFVPATASAASASFSAESAASSYTVGNTFTVSIYETSSVDVDSAHADLTYEAGLLEFQGISGGAFTTCLTQPSGGAGSITTGDCTVLGAKKQGKQLLATVTFKAIAAGSAHLNFSGSSRLLNAGTDVSWTASNGAYTLSNPVVVNPGSGGGSTTTPPTSGGSSTPSASHNNTPVATNNTGNSTPTQTETPVANNNSQTTPSDDNHANNNSEVKGDATKNDKKSSSKAPFFGLVAALLALAVAAIAFRKVQSERAAKAEAAAAAAAERTKAKKSVKKASKK